MPNPANTPSSSANTTAAGAKLNLNSATGADYKRVIPNFPDRFVTEFLEYKPYVSIQQFRKEMLRSTSARRRLRSGRSTYSCP